MKSHERALGPCDAFRIPLRWGGGLSAGPALHRLARLEGQGRQQAQPRTLRHRRPCTARRPADLGPCGQRRRNDRGGVAHRPNSGARREYRADDRHRDLRQGREGSLCRPRHPPICSARPETGRQPVPRPLATRLGRHRRIRNMADDHPGARCARRATGPGERQDVRPFLCVMEEAVFARRGAVRESGPCGRAVRDRRRTLPRARCPSRHGFGQPQGRYAAAACEREGTCIIAEADRRTADLGCRFHA